MGLQKWVASNLKIKKSAYFDLKFWKNQKWDHKFYFFIYHKSAVIFLKDKGSMDEFWSLFLYLGPKGEEIWPFFHAQFVGVLTRSQFFSFKIFRHNFFFSATDISNPIRQYFDILLDSLLKISNLTSKIAYFKVFIRSKICLRPPKLPTPTIF